MNEQIVTQRCNGKKEDGQFASKLGVPGMPRIDISWTLPGNADRETPKQHALLIWFNQPLAPPQS